MQSVQQKYQSFGERQDWITFNNILLNNQCKYFFLIYKINMSNITLTKVASTFKDNYQKYNIPIIDKDFLDISLEHVKKDILATLIKISSNFNRFKANIMLEIDFNTLSLEPL